MIFFTSRLRIISSVSGSNNKTSLFTDTQLLEVLSPTDFVFCNASMFFEQFEND